MMQRAWHTACALCLAALLLPAARGAAGDTTLIDFGAANQKDSYDADTGWNHQYGDVDKSTTWPIHIGTYDRLTVGLQDVVGGSSSISVHFKPLQGINLLSSGIALNNPPNSTEPNLGSLAYRMQESWRRAHGTLLEKKVFTSSWYEEITAGLLGAGPGHITVGGMAKDKTYVVSGLFSGSGLLGLLGTSAPITAAGTGLSIEGAYISTNNGLTSLADLTLGNLEILGLAGVDILSVTWIVQTSSENPVLDLSFGSSLLELVGTYNMYAMGITEYASKEAAVGALFSPETPEPGTGTLLPVAVFLLARRRRQREGLQISG